MWSKSKRPGKPCGQSWSSLAVTGIVLCAVISGCRTFYGVPAPPPEAAVRITPGIPAIPGSGAAAAPIGLPVVEAPPLPGGAPAAENLAATFPNPPLSVPIADSTLSLTPQRMVAPVGSEVVLLAGLAGPQGLPIPNQRIEWMISPDSAGQFVAVGKRTGFAFPLSENKTRKVNNQYAIGATATRLLTLTRGTIAFEDDVAVGRGQSWVSITSPTGGTSQVTAYAPGVIGWQRRQVTSTIYWIDALFSFPAPAIGPVGTRQAFNTIVTTASDGSPIEGYLVRYQIISGTAAAFAPRGANSVEVATDAEGRAAVEIFQAKPARGATTLQIEVVRPAGFGGADRPLVVGRGTTTMSWSAAEVTLTVTGSAQARAGTTTNNRIEVTNSGDLPLTEIVVTNRVPAALNYRSSTVEADSSPSGLEWRIGALDPGQSRTIDVTYDVVQSGSIENCAAVNTAENVSAENCLSIAVGLPGVDLQVLGPEAVTVGELVTFAISLTNRTGAPISGLLLKDHFDEGLVHEMAMSPIERGLTGELQPGQTRTDLAVTFRATRTGRLCHTVEISGPGIRPATARRCVIVKAATGVSQPGLRVQKRGPATARVGETVLFELTVVNTGNTVLTNVHIQDTYDRGLEPKRVSDGYKIEDGELVWKFERLAPGESKILQAECLCDRPVRACSRATVTTTEGLALADETCTNIAPAAAAPPAIPPDRPAPGAGQQLRLSISDLRDEVPVGTNVTYVLEITNPRNIIDTNMVVVISAPQGMTPQRAGTAAPSANWAIANNTIRFAPIAELRPLETVIYRFNLRADRAGEFRVRASVTSAAHKEPLVAVEQTSAFAE